MNLRTLGCALIAGLLFCSASLRAGVLSGDGIGAYGDSLSWQYSLWVPLAPQFNYNLFSNGHQFNWVDHLEMSGYNFGPPVDITGNGNFYNRNVVALGGAVSGDLPGQVAALQPLLSSGEVKLTVLSIGGNDFGVGGQYQSIYNKAANLAYNPLNDSVVQTFIGTVVSNITSAVNATLTTDPGQHMILTTVPDLGVTPQFRSAYGNASRRADVTTVVQQINEQILDLAALHGLPVVDLYSLGQLSLAPPTLAGIQMQSGGGTGGNRMYLSDNFHPGTVANGILANAILKANELGYGDPVAYVSDQTIAIRAGLTPTVLGPTYFDVSPYVIYTPVPEPSTLLLAAAAGGVLVVTVRRRKRMPRRAHDDIKRCLFASI